MSKGDLCLRSRKEVLEVNQCLMGSRRQAAPTGQGVWISLCVGKPLEGVRERIYIFKDDPGTPGRKDFAGGWTISTLNRGHLFLSPHYTCRGDRGLESALALMRT